MVTAINAQKTPLQESLVSIARGTVDQFHSLMGKAIPASVVSIGKNNSTVTVKLELKSGFTLPQITCPVNGPEYIRMPIQKGDKGMVIPSDYFLGAMSGMGSGVATLGRQANLSTMVWHPIGNTKFTDVDNQNQCVIYGPEGVVIKTLDGKKSQLKVDKDGIKSLGTGDTKGTYTLVDDKGFHVYINGTLKFEVDAGGVHYYGGGGAPGGGNFGINVTDTGTHIDNVNFLPHIHSSVATGPNNTGAVNPVLSPSLANEP